MDTETREENYRRQNKGRAFTARQLRRLRQRSYKEFLKGESQALIEIGPVQPRDLLLYPDMTEKEQEYSCPTCGALPDEKCRTRSGRPTTNHKGRE